MNALLVEDEDPKRELLMAFLGEQFPSVNLCVARSVRSAIAALKENPPGLLLLDMSLPTFDISPGEPGGRPQGFGGLEVFRYLDGECIRLPTIVITAYEAFPKRGGQRIGFQTLSEELARDFPDCFFGLVHFDTIQIDWREQLRMLINNVTRGHAL